MKYTFWDIVIVEWENIGVVIKSWWKWNRWYVSHEVYVRIHNWVKDFKEDEIERYLVRHKYLDEQELEYQQNAINT